MNKLQRFLCVVALCGNLPAMADILSIQPATTTVHPGQTFSMDVLISGASDLAGYQFDLGFNPGVLAAILVTEGGFLSGTGSTIFFPGTIDNSTGTISFIADLLDSGGASGSGTLATFSFTAVGLGASAVDLFNVTGLDSFGQGIAFTETGATVQVDAAPVPEPGTAALLFTTLLAVFILQRCRGRRGYGPAPKAWS